MKRFFVAYLITGLVFSQAPAFGAEHAAARLVYSTPDENRDCPDEAAFRTKVAGRLGYDPFTATSDDARRISVRFVREQNAMRARMEMRASAASDPSVRELVGSNEQCETLAETIADSVALALDPIAASSPHEKPPTPTASPEATAPATIAPAPTVVPPPPPPPETPEVEAPKTPWTVFLFLGGDTSFGLVPGLALGGHAGAGLRHGDLSLEIEGGADTSASAASENDKRVEGAVFVAGIAPCAHRSWLSACALFRAGEFDGSAPDVLSPTVKSSFFEALGAGVHVEIPEKTRLRVRFELNALVPMIQMQLYVDKERVWTASPLFVDLSLAVQTNL